MEAQNTSQRGLVINGELRHGYYYYQGPNGRLVECPDPQAKFKPPDLSPATSEQYVLQLNLVASGTFRKDHCYSLAPDGTVIERMNSRTRRKAMRCLAMAEYLQKRQREETFRHDVLELGIPTYDPIVWKRKRGRDREKRKNERKRERQEQERRDAIEYHARSNISEKAMKDDASNALLGNLATQNRLLDELNETFLDTAPGIYEVATALQNIQLNDANEPVLHHPVALGLADASLFIDPAQARSNLNTHFNSPKEDIPEGATVIAADPSPLFKLAQAEQGPHARHADTFMSVQERLLWQTKFVEGRAILRFRQHLGSYEEKDRK